MIVKQLSLEVWKDEYSNEFLELNNIGIKDAILAYNESFVLQGEKFAGKKHLIFEIMQQKTMSCYCVNNMSDCEIIDLYDCSKVNGQIICWILDGSLDGFAKDVQSRLRSLYCFFIKDLDRGSFEALFVHRLSVIGVSLSARQVQYCCDRLNLSYACLDRFIEFIRGQENVGLKDLKKFLDSEE